MFFVRRLALFWFLCAFFGFSGYFAIYNQDRVSLTLPPWVEHISVPTYIAFVIFFLLGSAVTWIYFGIEYTKKMFEIKKLHKIVRQHEQKNSMISQDHMPEIR